MEALELPKDVLWEGKSEPSSPSHLTLVNAADLFGFDDNFANNFLFDSDILETSVNFDYRKNAEQLFLELQNHVLEYEREQNDQQWLNQPSAISVLSDYPISIESSPQKGQHVKIEQTARLIREFDSVYDAVELTHLTPPQTPPDHLKNFHDVEQTFSFHPPEIKPLNSTISQTMTTKTFNNHANINDFYTPYHPNTPIESPMPYADIDHEMEIVEELVRTRAKDLPDYKKSANDGDYNLFEVNNNNNAENKNVKINIDDIIVTIDVDNNMEYIDDANIIIIDKISDDYNVVVDQQEDNLVKNCVEVINDEIDDEDNDDDENVSENSSTSGYSPRSETSYLTEERGSNNNDDYDDDDEWLPIKKRNITNKNGSVVGNTSTGGDGGGDTDVKKRPIRSYKRSTEDKKSRKKEQNKNAATRYRKKKKAEIEIILEEEQKLRQRNNELQMKHKNLKREFKYLKSLLRELYQLKGYKI